MSQLKKSTLIGVMLGSSMLAFGLLALTGKSSNATSKSDQYCWGQMAPRAEDSDIDPILSEACFEDEEEAQQFGAADAVYTHFTIYRDANFGGGWYKFWTGQGCGGLWEHGDFNLIGWNDSAGSAVAECGRTVDLYEHTYFGGASLRITGFQATLGVLNDQSSSWKEPY